MLKNLFLRSHITNKKIPLFNSFQSYNFARNFNPFVPIYPGDKVIVLPPWGTNKISKYEKKVIQRKYPKQNKIEYGTISKIYRKKGLVRVNGVNLQLKYTSPENFIGRYEAGDFGKIRRKYESVPVAINRVYLRDPSVSDKAIIVKAKLIKNDEGTIIRINQKTKVEIPILKKHPTYAKRVASRKEGPKDTPMAYIGVKSYRGENVEEIAKMFLRRIKEKEEIEANLILKDK
jgi:ribosomal protein L24